MFSVLPHVQRVRAEQAHPRVRQSDEAVPAFLTSWDARQCAAVCALTAPAAVTKDAVCIGSPWLRATEDSLH